jgi:AAA15 family ATPase/GTPase
MCDWPASGSKDTEFSMEPEAGLCCSSGAAGDAPRVKIALVYLLRIKTYYIAANGLRKMGRGALLLTTIRIRNFRTVADVTFNVSHKCALIGPNNVGKTNILYAVHLFFSLHPNTITNQIRRYVRSKDFPRSVESGRTTILLIFECEETPTDRELLTDYRGIKNLLGLPLAESKAISILLTFSESGKHAYQIFPNSKRPSGSMQLSELNEAIEVFFDKFFQNFAVHYLQSDKRFDEIYQAILLPSVKLEIAETLSTVYEMVKNSISSVNTALNKYMNDIGLSTFSIRLSAPEEVTELIENIEFRLEDEIESELHSKGMGIQALAVTASMLWLQQFYEKNHRSVLWLIEEPESFLHPSLMLAQSKIIDKLSERSTIIYATHALSFVPSKCQLIVGVQKESQRTQLVSYRTAHEATTSLRKLLGLRLGDFFNLSEMTIAVEGPTDKAYLEWFLKLYNPNVAAPEHTWPLLRAATIRDYGGIKPLQFFIQATYDYIRRETVYVALLDSDDAGMEARSSLQGFFSGKMKFNYESGCDFISIRKDYAVEGLFSDSIIKHVNAYDPKLIPNFSEDTEGTVMPFRVRDHGKQEAFDSLRGVRKKRSDLAGLSGLSTYVLL